LTDLPLKRVAMRDMRIGDLDEVLTIERDAQQMPWSRSSFEESLNGAHLCRVAYINQTIVAFHVICPVVDEMHILTIAVAPSQQGQGLGHLLMNDIVELATCNALEVRVGNQVAQALYQQWQFHTLSVRKGYYRTPTEAREDGLVMVKQLANC